MFDIRLFIESIKFCISFLLWEGFLPIGERKRIRMLVTVFAILLSFMPFVRNKCRAMEIVRSLKIPRKFKALTLKKSR